MPFRLVNICSNREAARPTAQIRNEEIVMQHIASVTTRVRVEKREIVLKKLSLSPTTIEYTYIIVAVMVYVQLYYTDTTSEWPPMDDALY